MIIFSCDSWVFFPWDFLRQLAGDSLRLFKMKKPIKLEQLTVWFAPSAASTVLYFTSCQRHKVHLQNSTTALVYLSLGQRCRNNMTNFKCVFGSRVFSEVEAESLMMWRRGDEEKTSAFITEPCRKTSWLQKHRTGSQTAGHNINGHE